MEIGLSVSPIKPWRTAGGPFSGHATLGDNLVSYWALSADGTDSVVASGNNLTNNNSVTFVAKGAGAPANMPANVANFVAASSQNFTRTSVAGLSGVYTWAFWFKRADAVDTVAYVAKWGGFANSVEYLIYNTGAGGNLVHHTSDGAASKTATATTYDAGLTWHLIVAWMGSDKIPHIQIDDGTVNDGTALAGTPYSASQTLYLGSGPSIVGYTNGNGSSYALWSRDLIAGERTDLYNAGAGLFY
jgi:hypothetical protein